jgi:hypothetical protein
MVLLAPEGVNGLAVFAGVLEAFLLHVSIE